jgi:hypothetical protein
VGHATWLKAPAFLCDAAVRKAGTRRTLRKISSGQTLPACSTGRHAAPLFKTRREIAVYGS